MAWDLLVVQSIVSLPTYTSVYIIDTKLPIEESEARSCIPVLFLSSRPELVGNREGAEQSIVCKVRLQSGCE